MSKFTTEVRYICETYAGYDESKGGDNVETIITAAAPHVFGTFPIYDENYRLTLETKILRHFYTREICEETVGLWKLRLNDKMNLIMPYYNKLYESELLTFNPFYDVDLTRDYERKDEGNEVNVDNENVLSTTKSNENESTLEYNVNKQDHNVTESESDSGSGKNTTVASENASANRNRSLDGRTDNDETRNLTDTTTKSGSETTTPDTWDLYSDTPQGGTTGIDITGNVYLTNARRKTGTETLGFTNRKDTTTQTGTRGNDIVVREKENNTDIQNRSGNSSEEFEDSREKSRTKTGGTTTSDNKTGNKSNSVSNENERSAQKVGNNAITNMSQYLEHVVGKQGGHTFSKMLMEFRETFLNIDKMIIKELEPLFFGLWE